MGRTRDRRTCSDGAHRHCDRSRRQVADLSIAQRQLLAICRAIASDARLIIMDEPTASLTRVEVAALLGLARDLSKKASPSSSSAKLNEVLEIASVSRASRRQEGGNLRRAPMTGARLASLMTGKAFVYGFETPPPNDAPIVLSARGLKRDGEFRDISFDVRAGEIVGIVGRLGSGRTELALALFGLHRRTPAKSGSTTSRFPIRSNRQAIAKGIAMCRGSPPARPRHGAADRDNIVLTSLASSPGSSD